MENTIKQMRKRCGLTQIEASQITDIPLRTYINYENDPSKAGTIKWTKKHLKGKKAYKAYVRAWTMKDGKKTYIKTGPTVHAFTSGHTKKYTNAKSVTVRKTNVSLTAGMASNSTYKIKAKVIKLKKGKKLISKRHAPKLRYLSSDKRIATVSKSGKIKAMKEGTCYVYAYAHNGTYKAVKVTVK